jgi:hypothetical protein
LLLAIVVGSPAIAACGPKSTTRTDRLVLSSAKPSASGTLPIRAPGHNVHDYTLLPIDTTAFTNGGTLEIEVRVEPGSPIAGSFDLYPPGATIATQGYPTSAASAYNVAPGGTDRLIYRFARGEVVTFAVEGNWFGEKGLRSTITYKASVRRVSDGKSTTGN